MAGFPSLLDGFPAQTLRIQIEAQGGAIGFNRINKDHGKVGFPLPSGNQGATGVNFLDAGFAAVTEGGFLFKRFALVLRNYFSQL